MLRILLNPLIFKVGNVDSILCYVTVAFFVCK